MVKVCIHIVCGCDPVAKRLGDIFGNVFFDRWDRYPMILLALSKCPILGAALNLERVITNTAMSNLPSEISHCNCPIRV